ncbi:MAG: phage tail sheath subtilisin-like domain-containing protein, partial [Gammaproteobacteria bacterium]
METSYPGVYVEEVSSDIKPVTSVSTSTAAFVGVAEKGPVDKALLITSVLEFQDNYGNHLKDQWLSHCVQQFFSNGGGRLYIARVITQTGSVTAERDYQQAFALLDAIEDINLVAVPGVGTPSMIRYGAEYCQKRKDCFFIGEMALSDDSARKAGDFIKQLNCRCSYGAVYFPWLKLKALRRASAQPLFIPPSGAIAGLYARTDAVRGVWKAPAGTQASLNGVVGLSVYLADEEQDMLNPTGINVIREFPAHGIVAWGARTLGAQTDPEFRYVPVRRTAIYLQQSIYK